MKTPALLFYPGDWQRDTSVQSCSIAARGLWIEMLCIMHQAEPRGYLLINGNPPPPGVFARLVGAGGDEVASLVSELERNGVFDRDDSGVIFSRRMVRDEAIRQRSAEYGQKGAAAGARSAQNPRASRPGDARNGGRPPVLPGVMGTGPKPGPSSSSSYASSGETTTAQQANLNDREDTTSSGPAAAASPGGEAAAETSTSGGTTRQRAPARKSEPSADETRLAEAMRAVVRARINQQPPAAWFGRQLKVAHALLVTDGHSLAEALATIKAAEAHRYWGPKFTGLETVRRNWVELQPVQPNLLNGARPAAAQNGRRAEAPDPVYEDF